MNCKCAVNVQGKSKVQLFFSSCLVDVSVAVIGPSCLSLVMVQGMRLLSRCWKQRLVGWLVVVLAVVVYTEHFEMLIPEWIFTKSNRATTIVNNE